MKVLTLFFCVFVADKDLCFLLKFGWLTDEVQPKHLQHHEFGGRFTQK